MQNPRLEVLRALGKEIEHGSLWPRLHCPVCESGYLEASEPVSEESAATRHFHDHPAFEPEWVHGTFSLALKCESKSCGQGVVAIGSYRVRESDALDEGPWDYGPPSYAEFYRVEYFSPPLTLLLLPDDASTEVRAAVDRAGKLLFTEPSLAATALRAAVEHFLSSQGVPAAKSTGGFLSLDTRIRDWRDSTGVDRVADLLLAVKWIGNAGAHGVGDLSLDDVLNGAEFIDEAFHAIYVAPALDERARVINALKGASKSPRSSRKK